MIDSPVILLSNLKNCHWFATIIAEISESLETITTPKPRVEREKKGKKRECYVTLKLTAKKKKIKNRNQRSAAFFVGKIDKSKDW